MLTTYDYLLTRLLEQAGVELLLVGDTLGMIFQGEETTIPVTMEQMIYHTRIVSKTAKKAMVIGDMPFLTYQDSPEEAIRNAGLLIKRGESARGESRRRGGKGTYHRPGLSTQELPSWAHIGFKPQSQYQYGAHIVQGKDETSSQKLMKDLQAVEEAGVFAVVIEAVRWRVTQQLTEKAKVPTIGIGSGPYCDAKSY